MMIGWIPALVGQEVNARVDIHGEAYAVVEVYPSTETRDNKLLVWETAKPWKDPE